MDAVPGHAARRKGCLHPVPRSVAGFPHPFVLVLSCVVIAAIVALIPLDIKTTNSRDTQHVRLGLDIQESKAHADIYSADWEGFLDIVSDAANLTPNELVTTCPAILSGAYGLSLVKGAGMAFNRNISQNLDALADSAEYPAWDSMTVSERESWGGDKANYDAYKYAMFLSAFGLKDSANEYSSFESSSGGSFTLAETVVSNLQRIGRIGRNWANSGYETVSSLREVVNEDDLKEYLGVTGSLSFNAEDLEGWPSTVPQHLELGFQTSFTYTLYNGSQSQSLKRFCSRDVYFLCMRMANKQGLVVYFDTTKFGYGNDPNETYPVYVMYYGDDSKNVYGDFTAGFGVGNWPRENWTIDMPVNEWNQNGMTTDLKKAIWLILYSGRGLSQGGVIEPDVPDYPESDDNGNDKIWYPVVLTPDITYPDLTTPPRPDNPYNPDNQTGTDKWKNDTTNNLLPLTGINFDQLFPFSMLADIPLLFNKVQQLAPSGSSGQYSSITVPVDWGPDDENLVIDLTWLHDLLLMTRPAVLVLLVAGLLWVTVEFWKSILTG